MFLCTSDSRPYPLSQGPLTHTCQNIPDPLVPILEAQGGNGPRTAITWQRSPTSRARLSLAKTYGAFLSSSKTRLMLLCVGGHIRPPISLPSTHISLTIFYICGAQEGPLSYPLWGLSCITLPATGIQDTLDIQAWWLTALTSLR